MFKHFALLALIALATAAPVIRDDLIAEINSKTSLWTAGHNAHFEGVDTAEARMRLMPLHVLNAELADLPVRAARVSDSLPDHFDWQEQGNCVHPIRNQMNCGSCWAFAASETLSDRFCIASNGQVDEVLSPQYEVSCDYLNSGCNGGILTFAWRFLRTQGTVKDTCDPYKNGTHPYHKYDCPTTCEDGEAMVMYKAKTSYKVNANEKAIMTEIMENGPVEAGFTVYEDFYSYKSGVYHHVSGKEEGGHAIKIVGWGVENGTKYWRIANSWDTTWGEKGFFRIVRGTNECGIEGGVVAGLPDVEPHLKAPVARRANALITDAIVAEVNASGASWTAKKHSFFADMTEEDAARHLGTSLRKTKLPAMSHFNAAVPEAWDAHDAFPGCVGAIRDQQQCGSCWAFGAAETASDRLCIAKGGAEYITLSPQYLVSCDSMNHGCDGGNLDFVWWFLKNHGTVADECVPYVSGDGHEEACPSTCVDGSALEPVRAKTSYDVSRNPQTIQNELMKNGPVEAAFTVYKDFYSYESGVYHHVTGRRMGGHAIKIVGWGEEDGVKYWRIANSWNTSWGEDGFFRIVRGTNECGIESNVVAGSF